MQMGRWIALPAPNRGLVFLRVDADARSVFRRADEFDAGGFKGCLNSVNSASACRGDAVFGFNAFDGAERHARFFTEPLD